jgi:hypothetical protein
LAHAMRTASIGVPNVNAENYGLFLEVGHLAQSGPGGSVASDPTWAQAIARLRDVDPDTELPGLPEPEVPDAGDSPAEAA